MNMGHLCHEYKIKRGCILLLSQPPEGIDLIYLFARLLSEVPMGSRHQLAAAELSLDL